MTPNSMFVLGHPVGHSKSPAMMGAAFRAMGLDWEYGLADCASEDEARSFVAARGFRALNVTMPYKRLAFELATAPAATARLARGANVLIPLGAELAAFNVDGQGCVAFLEHEGVSFAEARVAVCGTGPTSLAILHAAAQAGAAETTLLSRSVERARAALEGYARDFAELVDATVDMPAAHEHHRSFRETYECVSLACGTYDEAASALAAADVIVDATPLGMTAGDSAPFDVSLLHENQTILDVVYGHGETPLLAAARAAGCTAYDGAGMLASQAALTLGIVCDVAGVQPLPYDELFNLMMNCIAL